MVLLLKGRRRSGWSGGGGGRCGRILFSFFERRRAAEPLWPCALAVKKDGANNNTTNHPDARQHETNAFRKGTNAPSDKGPCNTKHQIENRNKKTKHIVSSLDPVNNSTSWSRYNSLAALINPLRGRCTTLLAMTLMT